MVIWTEHRRCQLLLSMIEQLLPHNKLDWNSVAENMGEGFTGCAIRQQYHKLRKDLLEAGNNKNFKSKRQLDGVSKKTPSKSKLRSQKLGGSYLDDDESSSEAKSQITQIIKIEDGEEAESGTRTSGGVRTVIYIDGDESSSVAKSPQIIETDKEAESGTPTSGGIPFTIRDADIDRHGRYGVDDHEYGPRSFRNTVGNNVSLGLDYMMREEKSGAASVYIQRLPCMAVHAPRQMPQIYYDMTR
ncbi:hypothetical protein RUND412_003887, partial [Rhizina undulata]